MNESNTWLDIETELFIGNNFSISQYYSERYAAVKFIFNTDQETKKVQYAVVNANGVVTIRTTMKEEYLIKFHKTVDIDPRVD